MKKIVLLFSLLMLVLQNQYGQDIIKTKSGEEKKTRLLNLNRKEATYKGIDDPEFSTYTIPYEELETIQNEGEDKPVYFNHKLPRAYLAISIGRSIPLGDYGKRDYESTDNEPGFAMTGRSIYFDAGFYIKKRIGVNISLGSFDNEYDYDNYGQQYANNSGNSFHFFEASLTESGQNKWSNLYATIGPMYSLKLSKRLTWDFIGRIGVMNVRKPDLQLLFTDYSTPNITEEIYNYSYREQNFVCYGGATNFRMALSKRFALLLSGSYLYSNPTLEVSINDPYTSIPDPNTGIVNTINTDINHKISALNLNVGIAYQFKRKGNKYE